MMAKRFLYVAVLVGSILVAAPRAANATTIPASCSGCLNTGWDIKYTLTDPVNNIYALNITAYYGASLTYTYIDSIAFKINAFASNDYEVNPTVNGPAEAAWLVQSGGMNSGGCNGTGGGFWCISSTGTGATHGAAGSSDTWSITLNIKNSVADLGLTTPGQFKALYVFSSGSTSLLDVTTNFEDPAPVAEAPEPASLALLGTGLLGAAAVARRRMAR